MKTNGATEHKSASGNLFAFQPDAARARLVEAEVRDGLAESIEAVLSALSEHGASPGTELSARIRREPVSPAVFGVYTDLVEAIFADDIDLALRLVQELCAPDFGISAGLHIVSLDDSDLGEGQAARYYRLIDDDPQLRSELLALTPAAYLAERERVDEAIALLDAAVPELAGELRALVREIVLVERPDNTAFGASSFQLWGALFLNPCPLRNRVAIAEALVHEAAHTLLFGFSRGQPLVINDAAERYPSPIREDPRPMDGVVHATYVLARMHYLATELLRSGLLTEEERRIAREARENHLHYYAKGIAVIEPNAKWTRAGSSALGSAMAYMAAAA